jgi:glycosyltransferase involved in cell wall biosynthesis
MKQKTVIHILNGEVFGGPEHFVLIVCRHLDQARYHPHIITLFDGLTAEHAREQGFHVDVVPMKSRWDFRVVKNIRNIIKQTNASLLHAHTIRSHLMGALAARKLGTPVVVHIHSPAMQECENRLKNWWNAWVESQLKRYTDRYVLVANSLRKYLINKRIPEKKISTLLNAIDIKTVVAKAQGMQPSVHERLKLDSSVKLIGMVAQFQYRKGSEDLLHAVKILGDGPVPYRLVMIGGGAKLPHGRNYLDVLKEQASKLGIENKVFFLGFQDNALQWMAGLDMFVLPSRFGEGLPAVVQEAMALGVPIIATPVEGTAEVLIDQVTGLLPPPENPEALAEAIKSLLLNPDQGKRMAIEAGKVVRERFDAPIYALNMMKIYDDILQDQK